MGEGFYLALHTDEELRARIDALATGQARHRPMLGVALAPAPVARRLRRAVGLPEQDGLLVRGVEEDSAAAAAGIEEGDLLVGAAGRALATVDDLYDVLDAAAPGTSITVDVVRGTEPRQVTVAFPTA
jgi:S1-C subfamily serine protease